MLAVAQQARVDIRGMFLCKCKHATIRFPRVFSRGNVDKPTSYTRPQVTCSEEYIKLHDRWPGYI